MILKFSKTMTAKDIENTIRDAFGYSDIGEFYFKAGNKWYLAEVKYDQEGGDNPRDWDGKGAIMACSHHRYKLGDVQLDCNAAEFLINLVEKAYKFDIHAKENPVADTFTEYAVKEGILVKENMSIGNPGDETYKEYVRYFIKPKRDEGWGLAQCSYLENQRDFRTFAASVMDYMNVEQLVGLVKEMGYEILPLYLYEHSGITMSVSSFNDRWDSGCVGYIYTTKEYYKKETGNQLGDDWRDTVKLNMIGQVKEYDRYLRGDVFGYVVSEYTENEAVSEDTVEYALDYSFDEVDSCWGFYNYDAEENGTLVEKSAAIEELASSIWGILSEACEEKMGKEELRQYIYNEFNVGDNCTIAPAMLDGILKYAEGLSPDAQKDFLKLCLPSIPVEVIDNVFIEKEA